MQYANLLHFIENVEGNNIVVNDYYYPNVLQVLKYRNSNIQSEKLLRFNNESELNSYAKIRETPDLKSDLLSEHSRFAI